MPHTPILAQLAGASPRRGRYPVRVGRVLYQIGDVQALHGKTALAHDLA
jgi:hypothetical protein